jgi:hypothetical protein
MAQNNFDALRHELGNSKGLIEQKTTEITENREFLLSFLCSLLFEKYSALHFAECRR